MARAAQTSTDAGVGASPRSPGRLQLKEGPAGLELAIIGDWTLPHYQVLRRGLAGLAPQTRQGLRLDFAALEELDTAGATLLAGLLGAERLQRLSTVAPELSDERRALLRAVGAAASSARPRPRPASRAVTDVVTHVGRASATVWRDAVMLLDFMGRALATLAIVMFRPHRWRMTAMVNHMEQTGLNAVPIVALLTFLVGAVVALLGATVLADFGATIYTVDLVAYSFMREFGVLLAAILVAGRTASAFTAQLGSMRANEEIDALRVQGLDPIELLVLPRVLALMLTLPLLSFIAVIAGLAGGGVVSYAALDIPPVRFFAVLGEVPLHHFWVGVLKAPVFAAVIALIGCLEGFKAGASAESVGLHTTSSVVQSIFMVILLDALAALFFMEIGW